MTHPLSLLVSATLNGLSTPGRYPYFSWEAAFVDRWEMIPEFDSRLAMIYIQQHHLNAEALTCVEALRAFHVNQFEPTTLGLFRKFVEDYDKVPPEYAEPVWENDPQTGAKLERYLDQHNPNSNERKGRKFFDLGRGKQPR